MRGNATIKTTQFAEQGNLTLAQRIVGPFTARHTAHQECDAMIQKLALPES